MRKLNELSAAEVQVLIDLALKFPDSATSTRTTGLCARRAARWSRRVASSVSSGTSATSRASATAGRPVRWGVLRDPDPAE